MGNSTINTVQIRRGKYPEDGFTTELKPYELGWTTNEIIEGDDTGKTLYIRDSEKIEGIIKKQYVSFYKTTEKPEVIIENLGSQKTYSGIINKGFIPIGGHKFKKEIKEELLLEFYNKINKDLLSESISSSTIIRNIALIVHPIGEVYTTTDINFNPNKNWGGTWEKLDSEKNTYKWHRTA